MEPASSTAVRTSILVGGHGVDGNLDGPGQPASTWREAEALGRVEPSGDGASFIADPDRLLDRVTALGVDEVLLRVCWARVEPVEGIYANTEIARVRALSDTIRSRGLSVGIVLSDGTLPEWLGPEGWLLPATPQRFVALGRALVDAVGEPSVVVALEEPATFAAAGWLVGAAPPFRRAAFLDSLAALDGMLASAAALAGSLGTIRSTFLSSPGVLGALEATLLGQPVPPVEPWAATLLARASAATPQRVDREARAAVRWPIAPIGDEVPLPPGLPGALLGRLVAPGDVPSLLEISSGASLRTVAALIDERGRVSRLRGHLRKERLTALLAAVDGLAPERRLERVVIGELTDRWRWGTYRSREGIVGVDRLRGPTGAEALDTDAAGVDAVSTMAAVLAAR